MLYGLRPCSVLRRRAIGWDEFRVLLASVSDTNEAIRIAERLNDYLETYFSVPTGADSSLASLRTSIGIAAGVVSDSNSPDELAHEADAVMYRAERRGEASYEVVELYARIG